MFTPNIIPNKRTEPSRINALVNLLIFSSHSMKYIWYSPKKVNILHVIWTSCVCWGISGRLMRVSTPVTPRQPTPLTTNAVEISRQKQGVNTCLIHGKLFPDRCLLNNFSCVCCSLSHWSSLGNRCVGC